MAKKSSPVFESIDQVTVTCGKNLLLEKALQIFNSNLEVRTLWRITNVTALKRLGMTDHGIQHFNIVANNALLITRLLHKRGIALSVVKDYKLGYDYAELIVFLASVFHDVGMSIHRLGHEEYSLFLTNSMLRETLDFLDIEERTIVISEVLHAIISHRSDGKPLTLEAGVVRVADALDMTEGRTRLPYEEGKIDIHSVSAMAIDDISILAGERTPVQVEITMNHTAGLFQIDELLRKKVIGSGLEKHLEIKIFIEKGQGKQLFKDFYQG